MAVIAFRSVRTNSTNTKKEMDVLWVDPNMQATALEKWELMCS